MIAEFEADLIRMRTREGMKVARAKGRLRGKQPKLSPCQEAHLVTLHNAGTHTRSSADSGHTRAILGAEPQCLRGMWLSDTRKPVGTRVPR